MQICLPLFDYLTRVFVWQSFTDYGLLTLLLSNTTPSNVLKLIFHVRKAAFLCKYRNETEFDANEKKRFTSRYFVLSIPVSGKMDGVFALVRKGQG